MHHVNPCIRAAGFRLRAHPASSTKRPSRMSSGSRRSAPVHMAISPRASVRPRLALVQELRKPWRQCMLASASESDCISPALRAICDETWLAGVTNLLFRARLRCGFGTRIRSGRKTAFMESRPPRGQIRLLDAYPTSCRYAIDAKRPLHVCHHASDLSQGQWLRSRQSAQPG